MTRIQRLGIALVLFLAVVIVIALVLPGSNDNSPTATALPKSSATKTHVAPQATTTPASTLEPGATGLFIEPDDGRAPILDELAGARKSIKLQIYLLSDREIIDALKAANNRGVDVRVLLEAHPFGGN